MSISRIWKNPKTCGIGQGVSACDRVANHAVAVHSAFRNVHDDKAYGPIVVFLCDVHFFNPALSWDPGEVS
jgi:hypothetical protein